MTEALNPNEVRKRTRRKEEDIPEKDFEDIISEKFSNKGGTVRIAFESQGRFNLPKELFFKDYTNRHFNDLTLSREDDLLENLIVILNECMVRNEDNMEVDVGDATSEEFLEILIGMKQTFNTNVHIHRWICECQSEERKEDQIIHEEKILLNNLKYIPITEADDFLKTLYGEALKNISDNDFKKYLEIKYKNEPLDDTENWTIENEINSIKIKDSIVMVDEKGNKIEFRFTRIKDIVYAQKIAKRKFASKIKQIENKKISNMPLNELKMMKKEEIDKVKNEEGKYTILVAKALSIVSYNEKEISEKEKIDLYSEISRNDSMDFTNFINGIKFGINSEFDFNCSICGASTRRWLQQELNIIELLPVDSTSSGKLGEHKPINIFIG